MFVRGQGSLRQIESLDRAEACHVVFRKLRHYIRKADEVPHHSVDYTRSLIAERYLPVLHESGLPAALCWLGEQMIPLTYSPRRSDGSDQMHEGSD